MSSGSFTQALSLQGRVLWALCLREIHGKHGKSKLGYLWELLKTGFGVAVFWWIRAIAGLQSPSSMPLPLFLLLGFIPWHIFSQGVSMTMEAVRTNKSLLTFPQIFTLDLYVSSLLVVWVTEVVVLGIYVLILTLAGYQFQLYAPMILWAALAGIGFFAFAVGLVLSIAALFFPVVENLVRMAMRVLFFTSGVFFSPTQLAGRFGDIVMWNPILNFIELGRSAFITRMPAAHIKIFYITCLTVGLLALGLLLERHVRSRQAA